MINDKFNDFVSTRSFKNLVVKTFYPLVRIKIKFRF